MCSKYLYVVHYIQTVLSTSDPSAKHFFDAPRASRFTRFSVQFFICLLSPYRLCTYLVGHNKLLCSLRIANNADFTDVHHSVSVGTLTVSGLTRRTIYDSRACNYHIIGWIGPCGIMSLFRCHCELCLHPVRPEAAA